MYKITVFPPTDYSEQNSLGAFSHGAWVLEDLEKYLNSDPFPEYEIVLFHDKGNGDLILLWKSKE